MSNFVDFTILFVMGISVVIGLFRGFIREALSLASWVFAIWMALTFSASLSGVLGGFIGSAALSGGLAFSIVFFLSFIAGTLLSSLLNFLVKKSGMKGMDRLLGMVFGFIRGGLVVCVAIMLVNLTPLTAEPWWASSQLVPKFAPMVDWLQSYIPNTLPESEALSKIHAVMF